MFKIFTKKVQLKDMAIPPPPPPLNPIENEIQLIFALQK